jgi:hypothetical protein
MDADKVTETIYAAVSQNILNNMEYRIAVFLAGHKFGDLGLPRHTINFSVYNFGELRFYYK